MPPITRARKRRRVDTTAAAAAAAAGGGRGGGGCGGGASSTDPDGRGLQDLPLELVAAIADYVHEFSHLAAMRLGSRRLHDAVSLSGQWRIVNEVMADVADTAVQRRIIFNRKELILHAGRFGRMRLLRFVNFVHADVTRKEAYSLCLPVACAYGQLEFVRYLMTKFDIAKEDILLSQSAYPTPLDRADFSLLYDSMNKDFPAFIDDLGSLLVRFSPFDIACACPTGLPLVKYFHEECGVSEAPPDAIICACREGRLDMVKYLHTTFKLTVKHITAEGQTLSVEDDFDPSNAFQAACEYGHLDVVKYLTYWFNLDLEHARITHCVRPPFQLACSSGNLDLVKYLHTEFGITVEDVRAEIFDGYYFGAETALVSACGGGHLHVVEYLHTAFGLTVADVRADDNACLFTVCDEGHLSVMKYLHTAFGLTTDDARGEDRMFLLFACSKGHLPLVEYLHTGFGLTVEDARAGNCWVLRDACMSGHVAVVEYLRTGFGLTAADYAHMARTMRGEALRAWDTDEDKKERMRKVDSMQFCFDPVSVVSVANCA